MRVLVIERSDISEALDMRKAIDLCEKAYVLQTKGEVHYPPRVWPGAPFGGIIGSALVKDPGFYIQRLHTGKYAYEHRRWLNAIYLVDYSNQVFVLMDASIVSELRTGAAAAVSARHLARRGSRAVGILGSSIVARNSLWALCEELPIEEAKVYSSTKDSRERYAREMSGLLGIDVSAVPEARDAVKHADVIVTATIAKGPVLISEDVRDGSHICSLGQPAEIDPQIFLRARVFTEFLEQSRREGKLSHAIAAGVVDKEAVFPDIGEVILGKKKGRTSPEEVTFFDSQGLTVQDALSAWEVYTQVSRNGKGRQMDVDFVGGLPSGVRLSEHAERQKRHRQ